ncbi:MAG: hypothetical protein JWP87_4561 [Labilithrix sp.]|nr:hypothetical protein [Labilithrix sp.]
MDDARRTLDDAPVVTRERAGPNEDVGEHGDGALERSDLTREASDRIEHAPDDDIRIGDPCGSADLPHASREARHVLTAQLTSWFTACTVSWWRPAMRHAHALALSLLGGALAVTVLCGACAQTNQHGKMQPDPGEGYTLQTTGAEVGRDDPAQGASEPNLTVEQAAVRLAGQICAREVRCHGDASLAGDCMHRYVGRMHAELASWTCPPAGWRARAKECLATVGTEPCTFDLAMRGRICESNDECPPVGRGLIPPGAALADAGL